MVVIGAIEAYLHTRSMALSERGGESGGTGLVPDMSLGGHDLRFLGLDGVRSDGAVGINLLRIRF